MFRYPLIRDDYEIKIIREKISEVDTIKEIHKKCKQRFSNDQNRALYSVFERADFMQLGKSGKNINSDFKELVAEGLSPKIQKALDLLRVVRNYAVHPGQINLEDGRDIALKRFHVLNFIIDEMISA